ncbi:hypothetical protein O6H91_11G071900 [Diphasiastrum complanatum]|uniref:Uncharacterized protein n=3 Tax=Diphasiastrum complanatum TaxID=34168 RepID=A0ACC2C6Z8_DIPCM|nr:hypothetical protein O6H91_11G015200 [Diphasiastrum complanatum]KAJ7538991.1 hypothetical protein O6H91_11G071900 [Diphasiastrum complanatum]
MEALKAYVEGPSLQVHTDETVLLHISHSNLKHYRNQLRFSLHITVDNVKEKLSRQCGTTLDSMVLQLYDDNNTKICDLVEVSRPLGFYSPLEGYRLHIVDLDPTSVTAGGWLEDTSLVEKYTISDEAYNKRDDTFKKFKQKCLAEVPEMSSHKITDNYMEDLVAGIHVGDRCEVNPGSKRGTVMFVGRAELLGPGFWVGVQYDEPVGKHDGIVKGHRYFNCPPAHGSMLRPDKVKVGDFPEVDPFEAELDEI